VIEPKVHNGQPGVLGAGHGLTKLVGTLEMLEQGQTPQAERDSAMQQQLTTQTAQLTTLGQSLAHLTAWWKRWPVVEVSLTAGLVLLGGLVIVHLLHKPAEPYVRALGAIDATLSQTWGSLPKPVQEQLSAT
jgi:hypothetical protein